MTNSMQENTIPKKIHYCWFGNNKPSDLMINCINTWKKYLPEYELVEWNNDNIKDIDSPFLKSAVENKKWAFVSDYIRLWALYNFGGIYFDTDVEVFKSFDNLLNNNFFIGIEEFTKNPSIGTATIGSKPGEEILKDLLSEYDSNSFIKKNGRCDLTPNPKRFVQYFLNKYNFVPKQAQNKIFNLKEGINIYPKEYFSAKDKVTENTYAVHHYANSWQEDWSVRTWINTNKYALHLLKKENKDVLKLPLLDNEELIFFIKINSKKYFALVKKHSEICPNNKDKKTV